MLKETKIYTLTDPITNQVRYVGKTTCKLKTRLNAHFDKNSNTHKNNWLRSLKNKDLKPIIEILDSTYDHNWKWLEIYWIEQFRVWGFDLTNLTEGGEGMLGYYHTNESKEKISKAHKGRKITWNLNPPKKEIILYTKEGIELKEYKSILECSKDIKVKSSHISSCCNGKVLILKNQYVTRYKNDAFNLYNLLDKNKRSLLVYDKNNNFIKEYDSLISASKEIGCIYVQIYKAIKLREGRYKDYIFKYKN